MLNEAKIKKISKNSGGGVTFWVILFVLCVVMISGCAERPAEPDNRPVIVIGSDKYPPFFFMDEDGVFSGIDVELAVEAFGRAGYKAEFVNIEWTEKDTLLAEGKVDCLWGSFSMTGREDRYEWIGPYMNSRQVVAVRQDSPITTFADLKWKSVAVQATSKSDEIFSGMGDPRIPEIKNLYCLTEFDNIFAALNNGYVDAIAGHETALAEYMKNSSWKYRILDEALLEVKIGAAFLKGTDKALINALNEALDEMKKDGFIAGVVIKYGLDPEKVIAF